MLTTITITFEMTRKLHELILILYQGQYPECFGRPMPEVNGLNQKKSKDNMEQFATTETSRLPPGLQCSTYQGTTDHITQHFVRPDNKTLQICNPCYHGVLKD